MYRTAVEHRARWLAELAEAIGKAQELAWRLSAEGGLTIDSLDLLARIECARVEVEALRCNGWSSLVCSGPGAGLPIGDPVDR